MTCPICGQERLIWCKWAYNQAPSWGLVGTHDIPASISHFWIVVTWYHIHHGVAATEIYWEQALRILPRATCCDRSGSTTVHLYILMGKNLHNVLGRLQGGRITHFLKVVHKILPHSKVNSNSLLVLTILVLDILINSNLNRLQHLGCRLMIHLHLVTQHRHASMRKSVSHKSLRMKMTLICRWWQHLQLWQLQRWINLRVRPRGLIFGFSLRVDNSGGSRRPLRFWVRARSSWSWWRRMRPPMGPRLPSWRWRTTGWIGHWKALGRTPTRLLHSTNSSSMHCQTNREWTCRGLPSWTGSRLDVGMRS